MYRWRWIILGSLNATGLASSLAIGCQTTDEGDANSKYDAEDSSYVDQGGDRTAQDVNHVDGGDEPDAWADGSAKPDVLVDSGDEDVSKDAAKDVVSEDVVVATGPCAAATSPQVFTSNMSGCPGVILWKDRNQLCGTGCSACTAAQWAALDGGIPPLHHYWTNDELGYMGNDNNTCGATAGPSATCDESSFDGGRVVAPMRVCYESAPGVINSTDPEGNTCYWTGCGFDDSTPSVPNTYFGGCYENPTAGTLCCCP